MNGILLTRGENNDYIIDYNAGEVIFTSFNLIVLVVSIVVNVSLSCEKQIVVKMYSQHIRLFPTRFDPDIVRYQNQ